jgi:signal transduction histidine kinase/CheY-like chemotaxis protein
MPPSTDGTGPSHAVEGEEPTSIFPEVLAALGRLVVGPDPIESILADGCGLVAGTLGVEAVALLEPRPGDDRLEVRAGAGRLAAAIGEEVARGPATTAGSPPEPLAAAEPQASWTDTAFLARHGLSAPALALLPGLSEPPGMLAAFQAAGRSFEPEELAFLEAAATWLTAALDRHRSELESQRLYERLAQADRMVSLGAMAGGVAHELNNPLSYVTSNLAFVSEEGEALAKRLHAAGDQELAVSAREVVKAVGDARDGVAQMCRLVRDLQAFALGDDTVIRPLDLTHVLECSLSVARGELKHRAHVERLLADSLPPVRANAVRLGQVFLNLLVNAARAIPEGHANDHVIRVRSFTAPGNRVAVEVTDTGCGIPAGRLERIFDPHIDGRSPGSGSGVGLSVGRGIVTALGGEIRVESQVGRGTSVLVLFPVALVEPIELPDPAPAPIPAPISVPASAPVQAPAPTAHRNRILVVDDEPLVGNVLERTLGEEFEVVPVSGSKEALELLARGETFDVIFSDLLMPGMSGMELFHEVERLDPALASRIVFLSGGAFTDAARDFLARPGVECIEKPFDLGTIRGAIARRLAAP